MIKSLIIAGSVVMAFVIVIVSVIGAAVAASKRDETVANGTLSMLGNLLRSKKSIDYQEFGDEALYPVENFRVSMSAMNHWENVENYDYGTYEYYYYTDAAHTEANKTNTLKGLQEMFNAYGATEMYVRINTTRNYPTDKSQKDYYHIRMHCLEESLKACEVAYELNVPINVELGVFEGYCDAFESQYPNFDEYPELDGVYSKDGSGKRKV